MEPAEGPRDAATLLFPSLIVRPGGTIAIADLFSATGRTLWSGPNAFRSIDQVVTMLASAAGPLSRSAWGPQRRTLSGRPLERS